MKRTVLFSLLALLLAQAGYAQSVAYEIAFPNRVHHEAEITATFQDVAADTPLEVRMSRTSPGRYALHEFAKNVYNVRAYDSAGQPLTITRPNPHQWDVSGHDGTVRVTYTLFGDRADGTYSGINNRYAHLNIPATFMWARGLEKAPVSVAFRLPEADWDVATQLFPTDEDGVFTAPDFWYFMDSPTHLGKISWRTWEVDDDGKQYTIRLALHHESTEGEVDDYARMARQVVAEQIAMWGDVPDFEPGTYTFIAAYLPYVSGDGMEHRNSTVLTSSQPLAPASPGAPNPWMGPLGTLSHEFFHAWNVERLRPAALEPFDFEAANMSGELWFAEGFTSYYDGLFIRRAGLVDDAAFARNISGAVNTVLTAPGRRFFSPVEMSMQAPFTDAAASIDPQNKRNTFISYYTWGAAIGLGLDLTLRQRYNTTLDDFMRAMWQQHGRPEIPYMLSDLERVLGEVTGDAAFATTFFADYVHGQLAMNYEALLAPAGFSLRKAQPGTTWLGASLSNARVEGALVAQDPLFGSPLYEAGISGGDRIVSISETPVASAADAQAAIDALEPGEAVAVRFVQNGEIRTTTLTLTENPVVEVVPFETLGREVTDDVRAFRQSWLGSKAAP